MSKFAPDPLVLYVEAVTNTKERPTRAAPIRTANPSEGTANPSEGGTTMPTPTTLTQLPSPSSTVPNPANSPLGHYLLHPGQETSHFFHHVLAVLNQVGHVVLPIVIGLAILAISVKLIQTIAQRRAPSGGRLVEIKLPATVDPKGASVFWRNLHSVLAGWRRLGSPPPHIGFEIEGSTAGTSLRYFVPPGVPASSVTRALASAWPGAQCQHREASAGLLHGRFVRCGELRLTGPAWRSMWTDHAADPLRGVLGAIEMEHEGTCALVQVLARPASARPMRRLVGAVRSLHSGKPTALVPRLIAAWRTTPPAPPRPDPLRSAEVRRAVDKVTDLPAFEVVVRYGVATDTGNRWSRRNVRARAGEVAAAFGVYADDSHFVVRHRLGCRRHLDGRVFGRGQVVGLSELCALAHLPYDEGVPGLAYASATAVAPPIGILDAIRQARMASQEHDDAGF